MEKNPQNKGRLLLIPSPVGDNAPSEVIPGTVLDILRGIRVFIVEETRTARRYLSRAGLKGHIEDLEFHELIAVHQINLVRDFASRPGGREIDLRLAFHTLLGSDHDDTVRTAGSIDSRSGGILQDVDGLDIGRVQGCSHGTL